MLVEQKLGFGEDRHLVSREGNKSSRGGKSRETKGKLIGALRKLDSKLLKFLQKNKSMLSPEERRLLKDTPKADGLETEEVGQRPKMQSVSNQHVSQVSHFLNQDQKPINMKQIQQNSLAMKIPACQTTLSNVAKPTSCCSCSPISLVFPASSCSICPGVLGENLMLPKGLARRKTLVKDKASPTSHHRSESLKLNQGHRRKSSQNIHIHQHQHVHCHHMTPTTPKHLHQKSMHNVSHQVSQIADRLTPTKASIDSRSLRSLHRRLSSTLTQQVCKPVQPPVLAPGWLTMPLQPHSQQQQASGRPVAFVRLDLTRPFAQGPAVRPPVSQEGRRATAICPRQVSGAAVGQHAGTGVGHRGGRSNNNRTEKNQGASASQKRCGERKGRQIGHGVSRERSDVAKGKESGQKSRVIPAEKNRSAKKKPKVKLRHHQSVIMHNEGQITSQVYSTNDHSQVLSIPDHQRQRDAQFYRDTDGDSEGEANYTSPEFFEKTPQLSCQVEGDMDPRASQEPYNTMRALECFSDAFRRGSLAPKLEGLTPSTCPPDHKHAQNNASSTWSSGFPTKPQFSESSVQQAKQNDQFRRGRSKQDLFLQENKENHCGNYNHQVNNHANQAIRPEECSRITSGRRKPSKAQQAGGMPRLEELRDFVGQSPLLQMQDFSHNAVTRRSSSRKASFAQIGRHSFGLEIDSGAQQLELPNRDQMRLSGPNQRDIAPE